MSTIVKQSFDSFGEALSFSLDNNNLSQSDFSKISKLSRSMVSKYINNFRTPRPSRIKTFEELLNVSIKFDTNRWIVSSDLPSLLNLARQQANLYKAKEPARDDLPELLELRDMIQKEIDKLVG